MGNRQLHDLGLGVVPLLQPDDYHHLAQREILIPSAEVRIVARPPPVLFPGSVPLLLTGQTAGNGPRRHGSPGTAGIPGGTDDVRGEN